MNEDEQYARRLQRMLDASMEPRADQAPPHDVIDLSGGAAAAAAPAAAAAAAAPLGALVDQAEMSNHLSEIFADLDDVYICTIVGKLAAEPTMARNRDALMSRAAAVLTDPNANHPRRREARLKRARAAERRVQRSAAEDWRALAELDPDELRASLGLGSTDAPMSRMSQRYHDCSFAKLKQRFPYTPLGFIRLAMTGSTKKLTPVRGALVEMRRFVRCAEIIESAEAVRTKRKKGVRSKRNGAAATLASYNRLRSARPEPSLLESVAAEAAAADEGGDDAAAITPVELVREVRGAPPRIPPRP